MQDYLACVQGVDDNVGKVLDYLDRIRSGQEHDCDLFRRQRLVSWATSGCTTNVSCTSPACTCRCWRAALGSSRASSPLQFVANIDLAPTFLDLAGLEIPDSMQGRSLAPLLRGESPADWRKSIYYRYYHSPGHHNTAAHYGVRTATHKLIYYWGKDAYEMFDLTVDPHEQHNLLFDPQEAAKPDVARKFRELKAEIARLQKEFRDDGQYADPATWPAGSSDGPFNNKQPSGIKTVAEAIEMCDGA